MRAFILVSRRFVPIMATLVFIAPSMAHADAAGEVAKALESAGLAAQASSLSMAQTHMRGVLDCLRGRGKTGYDEKTIDPCKDLGKGAIAETSDVLKKEILQRAAARVLDALKEDDFAAMKKDASKIEGALRQVKY